jgi:hypothetical protein
MKSLEQRQNTLNAYDSMSDFKNCDISRKQTIDCINYIYKIPVGTLYDWHSGKSIYGRKGTIKYNEELFYVIGALLGDGCIYVWRKTCNYVVLVGDKKFAKKYAKKVSKCTNKKATAYINRYQNIWFVRANNHELVKIFQKSRESIRYLRELIEKHGKEAALQFIEGFFDAEGCVKIIKEPVRITPKICLDICNTNKEYLDLIQKILLEDLYIEARYSIQGAYLSKDGFPRKRSYHLRIYKKEYVKKFFDNISTTKLKKEKKIYVYNWLNRERLILERKNI